LHKFFQTIIAQFLLSVKDFWIILEKYYIIELYMNRTILLLRHHLPLLTSAALFCGTIFALYTTYLDFTRFFIYGGSWLQFSETMYPNPVATPCFYGAFAFLAAFVWSLLIFFDRAPSRKHEQQKYLVWFLVAGNLFAWANALSQIVRFYAAAPGEGVSCSGVLITNPFTTSCFYGASLFLLSLIIACLSLYFAKTKETIPIG
jgi:hypothetical protein